MFHHAGRSAKLKWATTVRLSRGRRAEGAVSVGAVPFDLYDSL